jgi:hypothetical protein
MYFGCSLNNSSYRSCGDFDRRFIFLLIFFDNKYLVAKRPIFFVISQFEYKFCKSLCDIEYSRVSVKASI